MMPPLSVAPVPAIKKLPLVLVRIIPFVPPLADTLVSEICNGVVLLALVISTAAAPLVVIAPLVAVIVFVLSVASNPR